MPKVEMLTIAELREQGYTTFTRGHVQKLIASKAITGAQLKGKTWLVPLTKANKEVLADRQREPKLQKFNNDKE